MVDRDRTVLQRSKPSSRNTLIGEQPNPWNHLQLQDVMSRHRGAKQSHQYELSTTISLLSPAYLLFVNATFSIQKWRVNIPNIIIKIVISIIKYLYIFILSKYFCSPLLLLKRQPPQSNYQLYNILNNSLVIHVGTGSFTTKYLKILAAMYSYSEGAWGLPV